MFNNLVHNAFYKFIASKVVNGIVHFVLVILWFKLGQYELQKMGKFYMKIILKKDGTWQCNNSYMKIGLKRIVLDKWLLDLYSTTCLPCMTNSFSIFMIKRGKLRSTTVACIMLMKNYGSLKLIEKGNILFIGIYFNGMLSVVLRKFDFSCTCLRNIINLKLRLPPLLI